MPAVTANSTNLSMHLKQVALLEYLIPEVTTRPHNSQGFIVSVAMIFHCSHLVLVRLSFELYLVHEIIVMLFAFDVNHFQHSVFRMYGGWGYFSTNLTVSL